MRSVARLTYAALIVGTATVFPSLTGAQAERLTAREVVVRIKANIGVPWAEQTVDTF